MRTPLDHRHRAEAAEMVERNGWAVPSLYSHPERETTALRHGTALVDLSACPKRGLRGPGRPDAMSPRQAAWLDDGRAALACRLTEDFSILLATTTSSAALDAHWNSQPGPPRLVVQDLTSSYAAFGLLGPRLEPILQRVSSANTAFRAGTCLETNFAGVHAALIRPDGMGVPFVWLCVAWDVGEYVWQTLRDADAEPIGMESWHKALHAPRSA